jgi:hypothetical protein
LDIWTNDETGQDNKRIMNDEFLIVFSFRKRGANTAVKSKKKG